MLCPPTSPLFPYTTLFRSNGAILVMAAAVFNRHGHPEVAEIQDAYKLLSPLLGVGAASTVFALALLASGQNSTLTGTRSEEHTSELQSQFHLVCRLLLEKK